jgi:hypothetical protein
LLTFAKVATAEWNSIQFARLNAGHEIVPDVSGTWNGSKFFTKVWRFNVGQPMIKEGDYRNAAETVQIVSRISTSSKKARLLAQQVCRDRRRMLSGHRNVATSPTLARSVGEKAISD